MSQVLSVILKAEGVQGVELTEMLSYFESEGLIGILIGYSVFHMEKLRKQIQDYRSRESKRSHDEMKGGGRTPSFGDPLFDRGGDENDPTDILDQIDTPRKNPRGNDGLRRRRPPTFNDPIGDDSGDDENTALIEVDINEYNLRRITGRSPIPWGMISGLLGSLGFAFVPIVYSSRLGEYKAKLPIDNLGELNRYLEELEEERTLLQSALVRLDIWDTCMEETKNMEMKDVYPNPEFLNIIFNINFAIFSIERYKKCLSDYKVVHTPQPPIPTTPSRDDPLLPVEPPSRDDPLLPVEPPSVQPIEDDPMDISDDDVNSLAIAGVLGLGLILTQY
jgi:hypothetical protein